jgi:hypothetical protein
VGKGVGWKYRIFYESISEINRRRKTKWQKKTPDSLERDSGVDGAD